MEDYLYLSYEKSPHTLFWTLLRELFAIREALQEVHTDICFLRPYCSFKAHISRNCFEYFVARIDKTLTLFQV